MNPSFPLVSSIKNTEDENMKHLTKILTAFSHVAEMPVTFFNEQEEITWDCLGSKKICSLFPNYNHCSSNCMQTLQMALNTAFNLGEPYIFLCNAGMIKIAYPLTVNGKPRGGFFAGPVAMGSSRDNTVKRLAKYLPQSEYYTPLLISYLSNMKIYAPTEVSYIYDVFCNSVFSARILEHDYGIIHKNLAEKSPESKKEPVQDPIYPDNLQEQLLHAIRSGNEEEALNNFRLFYEKTYILEAGNLYLVKIRLMELFSIISKAASTDNTLTSYYLEELEEFHSTFTFSKTFDVANDLVRKLTKTSSLSQYQCASPIVQKAIDYMSEFYSQHITLETTADAIHTNPSYLSALFKKEMELTFSQYLTQLRLNHSLKLLAETHLPTAEIALMSGFSGQSYFTKVFREMVGTTPAQYRKKQNKLALMR